MSLLALGRKQKRRSKKRKFPIKEQEKAKKKEERKFPIKDQNKNRRNMQKSLWIRQYLNNTELSPSKRKETTIALSAVLTNVVEGHDNEWRALGIAVFDHILS